MRKKEKKKKRKKKKEKKSGCLSVNSFLDRVARVYSCSRESTRHHFSSMFSYYAHFYRYFLVSSVTESSLTVDSLDLIEK